MGIIIVRMRVALVHDDLVQWGGAERVLLGLCEAFPEAPVFTSVYDKANPVLRQQFAGKKVITSFLQKIPGWRDFYKTMLPLYPIAFEQFDFSGFDLVISQTTRFAKSVITKPGTTHICYCHTPPRFLWNFSGERPPGIFKPYFNYLRRFDLISSQRVDVWAAGSVNAADRIKKVYKADSKVIYPFIDLARFSGVETFDGGFYLVISRLNRYKRVDLAVVAANKLKLPLKVVGVGPERSNLERLAGPTVEFLGRVDDNLAIKLLAGCKALIVAGEEDFGLTPLEAQALGKPVIAYGVGGALETVIPGETGIFFHNQSVESLVEALNELDKLGFNQIKCISQARKFSRENFILSFKGLANSV